MFIMQRVAQEDQMGLLKVKKKNLSSTLSNLNSEKEAYCPLRAKKMPLSSSQNRIE